MSLGQSPVIGGPGYELPLLGKGVQLKPLCSPPWHEAILSAFLLEMIPSHIRASITNVLIYT